MPTILTSTPEMPLPLAPPRKRWTREQCAPLEVSGLFEIERIELVDGELISKMGKNRPHVNCFRLMLIWLQQAFGPEFVDPEAPIDVSPADNPTSEPEPDIIVLNRQCSDFVSDNPQPGDIRLLIEIGDSSLNFDLTVKASLYARAGIIEYWVLDVAGRSLFCHTEPVDGRYSSVVVFNEHETLSPLSAPGAVFSPSLAFVA